MSYEKYAWQIDKDHQPDPSAPEGSYSNAPGVAGPFDADPELLRQLAQREGGEAFRIYDDDGELYYSGRIIGDYEGFEPLDDFGAPNAGATEIRYKDKSGRWAQL